MRWFRYFLLALVVLSSPVWAKQGPDHGDSAQSNDKIPLPLNKNTAAELTRIRSGGKILSVDQERSGNRVIFRVKVLHSNGKVKVYHLDRDTGRNQ